MAEKTLTDTERLDQLEAMVEEAGGIVLHTGTHGGGPYAGLGILHNRVRNRSLRRAIDQSAPRPKRKEEA